MPTVKSGESRDDYLKRCIPYVMKQEGLPQDAAVGKCEGLFNQHLKEKNAEIAAIRQEFQRAFGCV